MRTIGRHADAVATLLRPTLARLTSAAPDPSCLEARSLSDLAAAAGTGAHRRLGTRIVAPRPLPAFDNSQMDGFAVRAGDAGRVVTVAAPVPAGHVPAPLAPGTAAPIMTGAPIPEGADAVFPVERTEVGAFPAALGLDRVRVPDDVVAGAFVRPTGSDLPPGAVVAEAGALVTPALLGALAAVGIDRVDVVRRLRVLVVSTGSELAPDHDTDANDPDTGDPGTDRPDTGTAGAAIGDANGVALAAALAEVGAEARTVVVPDDETAFTAGVTAGVGDWADVVLTTGGISAGAYEVVRQTLEPRGLAVTPVAMQPGGPQALGSVRFGERTVPVVSFPGNPVSALVSFEVFLRPVLAPLAGLPAERPTAVLPSAEAATSPATKHQVRRGRVEDGRVHLVGGPSSHLLAHYAAATHLVHVPVGTDTVAPGDPLTVWSL